MYSLSYRFPVASSYLRMAGWLAWVLILRGRASDIKVELTRRDVCFGNVDGSAKRQCKHLCASGTLGRKGHRATRKERRKEDENLLQHTLSLLRTLRWR